MYGLENKLKEWFIYFLTYLTLANANRFGLIYLWDFWVKCTMFLETDVTDIFFQCCEHCKIKLLHFICLHSIGLEAEISEIKMSKHKQMKPKASAWINTTSLDITLLPYCFSRVGKRGPDVKYNSEWCKVYLKLAIDKFFLFNHIIKT